MIIMNIYIYIYTRRFGGDLLAPVEDWGALRALLGAFRPPLGNIMEIIVEFINKKPIEFIMDVFESSNCLNNYQSRL